MADQAYVVAGAMSKCVAGSCDARLRLPLSHGVFINEKAQLNIKDCLPEKNIPQYGICSILGGPCAPATVEWFEGKTDTHIEKQDALLSTSFTMCGVGGQIIILTDGQEA